MMIIVIISFSLMSWQSCISIFNVFFWDNSLVIIFFMSITTAFSQPTNIESLRPQIDKYLSLVVADGFEKYGFQSADDIYNVQLGEPIQTIEMEYGFYSDRAIANDNYCMQDANEYRIPIITNDTIRAFAIVVEQGNKCMVVDFGASKLADKVDECYRTNNIPKHHKVKMLCDPFSTTNYLELSENDYVIVDNIKIKDDKNFTNKDYKHQSHHYSKNDVKQELYRQYKSNQLQIDNHKNNKHEKH